MAPPQTERDPEDRGRWTSARALQLAGSILLLIAVLLLLDVSAVLSHLDGLRPAWVGLAVLLSAPQLALCALRWRFTAGRLGMSLPFGTALREYYLSTLLNQLLPTGVAGDGLRVLRHGRGGAGGVGAALHAVLLERASGQLALLLWTLIAIALWLGVGGVRALLPALAIFSALLVGLALLTRRSARPLLARSHAALTSARALPVQLALSSAVVLTFLAQYHCAAAALGDALSPGELLRVAPPVLAAMALPLSFAGWGVREASSAALFSLAGEDGSRGAAVGIVYGVLTLLGSLPGALFVRRVR